MASLNEVNSAEKEAFLLASKVDPVVDGRKVLNEAAVNGQTKVDNGNNQSAEHIELVPAVDTNACSNDDKSDEVLDLSCNCGRSSTRYGHLVMAIMLLSNMLNYMDRFTIAGVLNDVKDFYQISNSQVGLLQTAFIATYTVFSLVFGYIGDRFNRKIIISVGIAVWSGVTLLSSFVGPDHFILFLLLRGIFGIGETCYSTIAPTIIADLFTDEYRTLAVSIFYLAIPVGSGMGYIIGAYMAQIMGGWQWALRATPFLGFFCVIAILVLVKEPRRGAAEGGTHLKATSWKIDLNYLIRHKSFMLSSAAFTCVSFVAGALAFWAPLFIINSIRVQLNYANEAQVSLIFGVITCLAGFSGVAIGIVAAKKLRPITPRADPLICGFGMITGAPFLLLSLTVSAYSTTLTWVFIFVGETLISLNWALVTDILLYTVIPTRRSMAEAVQILMSHAFGDAGSPYLVGLIADGVTSHYNRKDVVVNFLSMQYGLYMNCFVCVLGGGFFLFTAIYIVEDKEDVSRAIKGVEKLPLEKENGEKA